MFFFERGCGETYKDINIRPQLVGFAPLFKSYAVIMVKHDILNFLPKFKLGLFFGLNRECSQTKKEM